jgi:hypothetical protein
MLSVLDDDRAQTPVLPVRSPLESLANPIQIVEPPDPRDTERPLVLETIEWQPPRSSRAGPIVALLAVLGSFAMFGLIAWSGQHEQSASSVTGAIAPAPAREDPIQPDEMTDDSPGTLELTPVETETAKPPVPPKAAGIFNKPAARPKSRAIDFAPDRERTTELDPDSTSTPSSEPPARFEPQEL